MKDLEIVEYKMVEEFLEIIKKKFEGGDKEIKKIVALKEVEQGNSIMEEFVQEFKRAVSIREDH